ncbi:MAG: hypothetical protein LBS76_02455 [Mycoplasmataceae bacterium]|jgi:hypothetical protein|nr:hypothetical protein [Mycoplasmataceae bacterium]
MSFDTKTTFYEEKDSLQKTYVFLILEFLNKQGYKAKLQFSKSSTSAYLTINDKKVRFSNHESYVFNGKQMKKKNQRLAIQVYRYLIKFLFSNNMSEAVQQFNRSLKDTNKANSH